ncbi:hypothetical protein V8G54_007409 [Vigna mungo]|uniref:NPH3 domain-containing protein n=1 Tax=Vigna mungo TaxID=3915 RepID=A0AAQ3S7B2_VIGMU
MVVAVMWQMFRQALMGRFQVASSENPYEADGRGMGYKRLTEEEENEKRRRGLCFRCDERYSPGHVCRNKQLHVILLGQEEGVEEDEAPSEKEEGDEVNLQLNVSSIAGMTSKNSLKLWGTIKGNKVIVMVDSGASHNFLSPRVVGELGIQIEETRGYFVEVGNGQRLGSQGVCRNVELQLPTLMVKQDFYLFELVGVDVILGYEWLKSLGKFSADLGKHLLEIQGDGTIIEVRGDSVLSRTVASLKAVMKELRNEGEAYYVELGRMSMWVPSNWDTPISVQQLVEEYADLFQEQRGLPPQRSCDHAIVLKEGAAIPNIRPYRHPHLLKFCYGLPVDFSPDNIAALRCASEFLEMIEELEDGNIISKTEAFLTFVVLSSWKDTITVLKSSPNQESWWFNDVATFRIDHFMRIISAIRAKGTRAEIIGKCIMQYAKKWLPGMDVEIEGLRGYGHEKYNLEFSIFSGKKKERHSKEQKTIIETPISIIPPQPDAVSCKFMLQLLKMAMMCSVSPALTTELEDMTNSSEECTMLDKDVVQRIVEYFLMHEQQQMQQQQKTRKFNISRLLDNYLAEIARDPNLSITKF